VTYNFSKAGVWNTWYTTLILQTKPWLNIHILSSIRGTFCISLYKHTTVNNVVFQVRFKTINELSMGSSTVH